MDIIERLNDPELYIDAVYDAINEIERLRRVIFKVTGRIENALHVIDKQGQLLDGSIPIDAAKQQLRHALTELGAN